MRNLVWFVFLGACGGGQVSSEEEASLAYVGLDGALERALDLGLVGFNLASSANLDPQTGSGDVSGTMTVSGKADQGSSANKGLRLDVALVDYADLVDVDGDSDSEVAIAYNTDPAALPAFDLQLRGIPDGTLEGTIEGAFTMAGDLEGAVTLTLEIAGELADDGSGGVSRAPGTTHITGTATNDGGGTYAVDVTR